MYDLMFGGFSYPSEIDSGYRVPIPSIASIPNILSMPSISSIPILDEVSIVKIMYSRTNNITNKSVYFS